MGHRPTLAADIQVAADVVGVTAAVCAEPRTLHYLPRYLTGGIAEFMSAELLGPQLSNRLQAAGGDWSRVDWSGVMGESRGKPAPVQEVACEPLRGILGRVGVAWIDFAIIDTEGAELSVLRTIDWGATRFGVLVVETDRSVKLSAREHEDTGVWPSGAYADTVREYMLHSPETRGEYRVLFHQRGRNTWFVHQSLVAHARAPRGIGSFSYRPALDGMQSSRGGPGFLRTLLNVS